MRALPHADALPAPLTDPVKDRFGGAEADVAFVDASSRDALTAALDSHLDELAPMRAVWLIYPKGNAADINRDSIWDILNRCGWRAVSQVAVDSTYSAVRARPLKPGEAGERPANVKSAH